MSQQIRNAITAALPREARSPQYSRYVDAAVTAVDGLRAQAANSLRSQARGMVSSQHVEEALITAGLVDRPAPAPTPAATQEPEDTSAGAAVARLEAKVDALIAAAEARGLRI
jgi:hypothetical protein